VATHLPGHVIDGELLASIGFTAHDVLIRPGHIELAGASEKRLRPPCAQGTLVGRHQLSGNAASGAGVEQRLAGC
jgi:hypothetical protein